MRLEVKDSGVGGTGVVLSVLGVGGSDVSPFCVGLSGLGVSGLSVSGPRVLGPGVGLRGDGVAGVGFSVLGDLLLGDSPLGVSGIGDACVGSHNVTSLSGASSIKSSSHSAVSCLPVRIRDGLSRLSLALPLKRILLELEYEYDVDKAALKVMSVLSLSNMLSSSAGFA